ncbi:glycosyltransferase family 4 protein [Lentilitoribacter sp. EG35]|uniref:glycosyltransferase family 4 protein n=1 Tax=Lentilitoribacter sp. EG35 TaxID=3234192 RepID=UPI00345F7325
MKILVISQYFYPEEFRINDVVKGLSERGHEVTVLTGMPNYPKGTLFDDYSWWGPYSEILDGSMIIRVPQITRGKGNTIRLALNYLSFALSACFFGIMRCSGRFDIIFVCQLSPATVGIPARFIARIKNVPILFWVQDLWPESLSATGAINSPFILSMVRKMVQWIYKGCTKILVQSLAFVNPIVEMGVRKDDIVFFPNGAETLFQTTNPPIWDGPSLPDGFHVMFAGNIGKAQSFETILTAAKLLKTHTHIHWIILGDGRDRDWVCKQIIARDLQQNVHIMGRHPVKDMPKWFAKADVMLATLSKKPIFALTVPAKIQSYLAFGKPIISAIDGETANVVRNSGAGYTVASEDAKALSEAILKMSSLPRSQLIELGDNGKKYFAENYDREMLLDRLENWCKRVLEKEI